MRSVHGLNEASSNDCMSAHEESDEVYNLGLHIVSVFVLLIVSFLGATISVVSTRVKQLRISPIVINTGKFFGSGVVLATGFIHMLPPAMESLTHPCLPDSWNIYGAYAGLFAMLATLIMQFIEFIAHERYHSMRNSERQSILHSQKPCSQPNGKGCTETPVVQFDATSVQICTSTYPQKDQHLDHHHHHHGIALQNDAQSNKIGTYLLEFGIALHSVLIGLTLGTTTESFVALFIALTFHQFFEAVALGAQVARLERVSLKSVIFMVVFFALTTPIGIAIGIGIHSTTYNPDSIASLLVNGILDAVSGGILIYVALVNLIAAEMGAGAESFHSLSKRLKFLYFTALYAGVAAMAVIGRWA